MKVGTCEGNTGYSVLNLQGEVILHHNDLVTEDETENSINFNHLSPDIYIIRFDFGNTKQMSRIVKK